MKRYLPLVVLASVFLLIKLANVGIRLSDTNIYFYTGYQLLQGKILYKDIFFTNFPLLPYISAVYFLLTGGNIVLFFLTPAHEVAAVAFLIYHLILKQTKQLFLASLATILYLFSFTILATSDHQTGVFLASLFAVLSFFFFQEKRFVASGIFIGLSLMTKAYFLPIFLTLVLTFFFGQAPIVSGSRQVGARTKIIIVLSKFLGGFFITIFIVLLPSLLLAPQDLYKDIIQYSLVRSQGISKSNIIWFFVTHDFFLFLLFLFNLFLIKRYLFFGLLAVFSFLFLVLYKDIYFLYLNFLLPFLCLSLPNFVKTLEEKFSLQKMIIPTLMGIGIVISVSSYFGGGFHTIQKVQTEQIVAKIREEKVTTLYGTNDITPLLAYLSKTKLLHDVIDTNENIYRKGFLNSEHMTRDAIQQKALIISHGAYYPESGIDYPLLGGIFDERQIVKSCKLVASYPVRTEGIENRVNLFRCR